jgi:DNA replication and repair protein RecF
VLAHERGAPPLLLLDDVMSELDADRRALLVRRLDDGGQAVITTTDLAHVPGAEAATVTRLAVAGGAVLQPAREVAA